MTIDTKSHLGHAKLPHTVAAAFKLSWELVGARNIIKALFPLLLLLALLLLLVPVSVVLYLNAQQDAKLNAMYEQVQNLQHELSSLQKKCRAYAHVPVAINTVHLKNETTEGENTPKEFQQLAVNESPDHHEVSSRNRRAVSNKPLISCPKYVVAKQFRGDVFQFIPSNGYVTIWKEEVWCNDTKGTKIVWDKKAGGIKILQTGIYQVNAQLTFMRFENVADFQLKVESANTNEEVVVSQCRVSKNPEDNEIAPTTCATSLLLCLNKNDRLFIFVGLSDLMVNLDKVSSFIGLARISKMPTCPPMATIMTDLK